MAHRWTNYLRKNAKVVMAVMCVVCMITFVVGPYLLDWVGGASSARSDGDPLVVTWTKGAVRDSDLRYMRMRHDAATNFVRAIIFETLEAGGSPVVGGRTLDRTQQINDIGFPEENDDATLIQTMLLAEEGRRMGVAVDQEAVKEFLRQLSAPELNEGDWKEIADKAIDKQPLTESDLFDQLATELRAQHVRVLMRAGLLAIPPGEMWDFFNRLNRRFSIEAYPIDVQPLVSQVSGEPTPAELQALFEKGQSRDPNPGEAEPGFHQPLRIAFDYVKVDFKPFLEAAKKMVTEEQIEAQYKKDIEQGLHKQQLELPPASDKPAESEKPADGDKPANGEKPAEGDKKEGDTSAKPGEKPAENPAEEKPAEKPPAKEGDSPCGCQVPPAAQKPEETKPAEKPAEEKPADPTKPAEENPANPAKPAEPAKPGEEKPADPTKPADPITPVDPTKPAEPAKVVKFKPLAEVHDQIQTSLAQPIAQEAQSAAVKALVDEINAYGKQYRRWQGVKDQKTKSATIKDPGELKLKELAAKHGFTSGSTPLVDRYTVRDYELGQKVSVFDFQFQQFRMLTFSDIAFGENVPLYDAQQADSSEPDNSYIFFRTEEIKASDVTLAVVKPQVVEAWKLNKAYELALKDAAALAEKAKGVTSLKDVVSDGTKVLSPAPFSWMTTGSLAFGFGQPSRSPVEGIDLAGDEFMRAVFALAPGEAGVAPNNAHTRVYLVRVVAQSPSDDLLREQFLDSGFDGIGAIANREVFDIFIEWYDELEKRMNLKWERPPQSGSRT